MGLRGSDEEQSRAYYRQAAGTQAQSTWHDVEKYRPSLGSVRDDEFCPVFLRWTTEHDDFWGALYEKMRV